MWGENEKEKTRWAAERKKIRGWTEEFQSLRGTILLLGEANITKDKKLGEGVKNGSVTKNLQIEDWFYSFSHIFKTHSSFLNASLVFFFTTVPIWRLEASLSSSFSERDHCWWNCPRAGFDPQRLRCPGLKCPRIQFQSFCLQPPCCRLVVQHIEASYSIFILVIIAVLDDVCFF